MSVLPTPVDGAAMGQLIASTPALLGFHTTESIVVFGTGSAPSAQVTMRADLPAADEPPDHIRGMAHQIAAAAATNAIHTVYTWIISARTAADHTRLVTAVENAFAAPGIEIAHFALVTAIKEGATWSCSRHDHCGGTLPDPRSVPYAAAAVHAGLPTYADRDELKAHLSPGPDDRVADVADRLAAARSKPFNTDEGWRALINALSAATQTPNLPELDADTIVTLTVALQDPQLRDIYQVLALDSKAGIRLMTVLTRLTPSPERAIPAALLATHHYLAGDGARARIAAEAALDADPHHGLARLLSEAIDIGMPPHHLRDMIRSAASDIGLRES